MAIPVKNPSQLPNSATNDSKEYEYFNVVDVTIDGRLKVKV